MLYKSYKQLYKLVLNSANATSTVVVVKSIPIAGPGKKYTNSRSRCSDKISF